jgi:putative hydrolase of the HAD superfamily
LSSNELYGDAIDILQSLSRCYLLVLATKGDAVAQDIKINRLGLHSFFKRIYILPQKTELEYSQIIGDQRTPRDNVWVVGNSVRSDINPALRLGLRAILIPRGSWLYEEDVLLDGDVVRVASLTEAASIIFTRDLKKRSL